MSTSIRYLRLYLHRPPLASGRASEPGTTASRREAIGYLSQYGDILRVSFDEGYIRNPQRPTLSLSYQGADEAARGVVQLKDLILGAKLAQEATLEEWKSQPAQVEVQLTDLAAQVQALLDRHK